MKRRLICTIYLITGVGTFLSSGCGERIDHRTPREVVKAIADRVIRETTFDFELVPQETVLGIQFVDFRRLFGAVGPGVGYALGSIHSVSDTIITFGISGSDGIKVWLNSDLVYHWDRARAPTLTEIAYERFAFQDTFEAQLQAGSNPILVKVVTSSGPWIFFLQALTAEGGEEQAISFSLQLVDSGITESHWLCLGPFELPNGSGIARALEQVYPPESAFMAGDLATESERKFAWIVPRPSHLWQLTSNFKRWAYNDWHYAHGATMFGILALADASNDRHYFDFVRRYCDFIMEHYSYFKWQYQSLHAFRGSFHRLFRRTMLDDTGAPALPFVELYLRGEGENYKALVFPISDYISHRQVRLTDGTFCRPEPVAYTVWADDLFMSVPYLLRMARVTGDPAYFDDAARQVIQFAERLFVAEKGLFKHAWFGPTGKRSVAFWGRANGWMVWAMTEALTQLPKAHPRYPAVLDIFRRHMDGLVQYQDPESGMWHQVLDHPESYEETSCTSMFVLGMARGIREGWLAESFRERALKGWSALQSMVAADGTVRGTCRGTGIGESLPFYFERPTFDHDPRGLGSMIIAGIEVARLQQEHLY